MLKTLLKNLLHSNCDLWSLQNQHSRKHQNLSYLSHKEKALQWCSWKYFFTWGRHIPKTSIAENIFERVSFSNCDPESLENHRSRKQQNLSYISPNEKSISPLLLKIPVSFFFMWPLVSRNNSKKIWVFWGLTEDFENTFLH